MQTMTLNGYQEFCWGLANKNGLDHRTALTVRALKLCGEAAELVSEIRADAGRVAIRKEGGDVLWYLAVTAWLAGFPFEAVAALAHPSALDNLDALQDPEVNRYLDLEGNAAEWLVIKAGVVAEMVGKHVEQGHPLDQDRFLVALSDVLTSLAWLLSWHDVTLTSALQANVQKLQARYPQGFTKEASLARVDVEVADA